MCPPADDSARDPDEPTRDRNTSTSDRDDPRRTRQPDFDQDAMYAVVRAAVKDAMLDVIGTVLLVGIAMVVLWAGASVLIAGGGSPTSILVGLPVVVFAVYLAASAVDLIPSVWEWL